MKSSIRALILGSLIAILTIGAPAYSQYIFMDTNGDGVCDSNDVLTSGSTAVDVWLNTNHNQNGTMVTCSANPDQPLTIFSYDILFNASGAGSVTYNSWTNADSRFTVLNPLTVSGTSAGVSYSYGSDPPYPPAG